MAQIEVQEVQEVQKVQIRPIRPIRGKGKKGPPGSTSTGTHLMVLRSGCLEDSHTLYIIYARETIGEPYEPGNLLVYAEQRGGCLGLPERATYCCLPPDDAHQANDPPYHKHRELPTEEHPPGLRPNVPGYLQTTSCQEQGAKRFPFPNGTTAVRSSATVGLR